MRRKFWCYRHQIFSNYPLCRQRMSASWQTVSHKVLSTLSTIGEKIANYAILSDFITSDNLKCWPFFGPRIICQSEMLVFGPGFLFNQVSVKYSQFDGGTVTGTPVSEYLYYRPRWAPVLLYVLAVCSVISYCYPQRLQHESICCSASLTRP